VLLIFNGHGDGADAEAKQRAIEIESETCVCEHDPHIKHRADGCYNLTLETSDLLDGRPLRRDEQEKLASDPVTDGVLRFLGRLQTDTRVIREAKVAGPRPVRVSPACEGLTLRDFPKGHSFGNGTSVGSVPVKRNGVIVNMPLSWVVLPTGTVLSDAQYEQIRAIMEDT
jgi:hypothetical protein